MSCCRVSHCRCPSSQLGQRWFLWQWYRSLLSESPVPSIGGICCSAAYSGGGNCDLDCIRLVGNCLIDKLFRCFLRERSCYLGDGLSLLVSARLVLCIVNRCLVVGRRIVSGNSIAFVILNGHHITGCWCGAGAAAPPPDVGFAFTMTETIPDISI